MDIFKHTAKKNKKIKRADQILPEVYGTTLNNEDFSFVLDIHLIVSLQQQSRSIHIIIYLYSNTLSRLQASRSLLLLLNAVIRSVGLTNNETSGHSSRY